MKGSVPGMWLLATVISLSLLASVISLSTIPAIQSANYRLSKNVLPSLYNLTISIQGDATNPGTIFDGEVAITLRTTQTNVLQITLHKSSLNISSCSLYNKAGVLQQNIATSALQYDDWTQQLTVPLSQALSVNEDHILHFKFTGNVRSYSPGFFSEKYLDQNGQNKTVLLTQMQRNHARRVFPCFDEPAFKAKFEVHIGRPSGFNAISNKKLVKTTKEGNNRFMDHFDVTPVMSTYLLAFVISEYTARGDVSDFAVVSRPEYHGNTEFCYNVGKRALAAFDVLFEQPYKQLGNQALLFASSPTSIPRFGFQHNGMENWGLIIFSEDVLVQHPGVSDGFGDKEFATRTIAHEISHMWFGGSVTPASWSYYWLKEAFARYYEYFMAHQLNPEYQMDQTFLVRELQMIMETDSKNSTEPMTDPETRFRRLTDIPYAKGASIIRMWRTIMGGENFDKAIRDYLKQHHLGNTVPSDLFPHLKQNWPVGAEVDLDELFYDYTKQVGFPIVTVTMEEENRLIVLTQKRFLLNRGDGSNSTLRYTIPITLATNLKPNFQNMTPAIYFRKSITKVQLHSKDPVDWIILNLKQANYYRVFYDAPILQQIQLALSKDDHSSIPVESRSMIVDDLFNFAHANMLDYVDVFKFVEYMSKEVDYIPWYSAYRGMLRVVDRLTPQQLPDFEKYLRDITGAVYKRLGAKWNTNDTVLDVYNRDLQVYWLCKFRNANCNNEVQAIFDENKEVPPPDYRETFYCAAARTSGYDRLLSLFNKETNVDERSLLWRAVSCTRDYRRHYKEILSRNVTNSEKNTDLIQMFSANPDLITPIYEMITENINMLYTDFNGWDYPAYVLGDLVTFFTTREQEKQFSNFVELNSKLFGSSSWSLKSGLRDVKKIWTGRRSDLSSWSSIWHQGIDQLD